MEKQPIEFAHFHEPIFFAGRNWGEKLDVRNTAKGKFEMFVIEGLKIVLSCGGRESNIVWTNIVSYEFKSGAPIVKPTTDASANPKIQAQVSGPHDHVFAGQGAGQTGTGKKVK